MPNSPKAILDRMVHKGAMTEEEREKILRNLIRARCKECKHRNAGNGLCFGRGWPVHLVPNDGFCDKGERREW